MMNKNKRAVAETTAQKYEMKNQLITKINSKRELIPIENHNTPRNLFQYHCSFCWRELPNNSIRFAGFGACPACNNLAHLWVNSLREHAANYFSNLGVRK